MEVTEEMKNNALKHWRTIQKKKKYNQKSTKHAEREQRNKTNGMEKLVMEARDYDRLVTSMGVKGECLDDNGYIAVAVDDIEWLNEAAIIMANGDFRFQGQVPDNPETIDDLIRGDFYAAFCMFG